MPTIGTVKWFGSDKGFGVIVRDDGEQDGSCHRSIIEGASSKRLAESVRVAFDVVQGLKEPAAENVVQV